MIKGSRKSCNGISECTTIIRNANLEFWNPEEVVKLDLKVMSECMEFCGYPGQLQSKKQ